MTWADVAWLALLAIGNFGPFIGLAVFAAWSIS